MKAPSEFDEEDKRESESNWQMGFTSTPSFETIGSRAALTTHNLQILLKKETTSDRQIIPATLLEKLAFYRAFASSPSKTQIVSMQQVLFNKYLWFYIFDVFCKSLPSTYVYVFLSSYAPEEHIFLPKMIPFCYGYLWYCIISAFFAVNNYCGYIALLWDYIITGLLYKNPWNRCAPAPYYHLSVNTTCYDVNEFAEKIKNHILIFNSYGYIIPSDTIETGNVEIFQMAPLLFLKSRMILYSFKPTYFWMFETLVILIASVFYKQLFKKYIWKILHCCQCVLVLMYLLTFCHLLTFYFINGFKKIPAPVDVGVDLWNADVDVLAESMASPPVVHILSARSTEKPKPSRDSTRIIVSNAAYYILRGLLAYMMKRYCEHVIGASLFFSELNPCSSFFYWPIYFSYFYLGDYYTLLYFLLNGIEEFLVLAITLYCLIEALACEWRKLKSWYIAASLCIVAIVISSTTSQRSIFYIYVTAISTLAETIVVFCLYPLGRLVDDITFHCGAPPTTLRIWNFRFAPVFYTIKMFVMFKGFLEVLVMLAIIPYGFYALYVQVIPFILGSFYAIYDVVYRKKQGWKQLFIPVPEWGPKDPVLRRLRTQYDSRQYIGSQAPRELSRYFIEKAELTTCQVDIQYDYNYKQRDFAIDVNFEDEKKNH